MGPYCVKFHGIIISFFKNRPPVSGYIDTSESLPAASERVIIQQSVEGISRE